MILEADPPGNYVLATGQTHTVRSFVDLAFDAIGVKLSWSGAGVDEVGRDAATGRERVRIDPAFFRPAEVDLLLGDFSRARDELGWAPATTLEHLCGIMVEADLRRNRAGASFYCVTLTSSSSRGRLGSRDGLLVPALREAGASVVTFGHRRDVDVDHAIDLMSSSDLTAVFDEVRPTHVVHLAGVSAPTHTPVSEIYAANLVGTVNLLEALARHPQGLQRVLLPSSATLYAPPTDGRPIDEEAAVDAGSHYAASKLAMERAAGLFRDLPIQIVRPFNYTGVGQRPDFFVPKVVEHFASGSETLRVGNLALSRDISDVADVVEAFCRLLSGQPTTTPLNICSGQGIELSRIVSILASIAGRSMEIIADPAFMRPSEPTEVIGSRARLEAAIGAWPLRPIEATLEEMYRQARPQPLASLYEIA